MTDVASPAADQSDPPDPDPLRPWPDDVAWRPVSPRLNIIEQLQLAILMVTALAVCGAGWLIFDGVWWPVAGTAALLLWAVRAVLVLRSVRSWGYAERAEDLLVRHGLMVRHLTIVPYARMQFVDVSAGPLERAFGLATVALHTAAAATDARVPGLPGAEAARLRDRLSALGETRQEGL